MYGLVFEIVEEWVLQQQGPDVWQAIKDKANCQVKNGDWLRRSYYPDEELVELVMAASQVLSLEVPTILEAFGHFVIRHHYANGYNDLLVCQGSNMRQWLSNLNAMHDHLQHSFEDKTGDQFQAPIFWCEDDDRIAGSLLLHYYSLRGTLLVPMVVGIVKELAVFQFEVPVSMTELALQGVDGADFTTWRITALDESQKWKLSPTAEHGEVSDADLIVNFEGVQIPNQCPYSGRTVGGGGATESSNATTATTATSTSILNASSHHKTTDLLNFSIKEDEDNSTTDDSSGSDPALTGMTPQRMKSVFPFHVLVDSQFTILQVGELLPRLLNEKEHSLLGQSISTFLEISRPVLGSAWDWKALSKLADQQFFLLPKSAGGLHHKGRTLHKRVSMKGNLVKFKACIVPLSRSHVMFQLVPHANHVVDLNNMGLTLSELPLVSCQREAVFLGEHIRQEVDKAHKLDKLSKKLRQEQELSNALLYNMLPKPVADELRNGKAVEPKQYENVTLFFSDIEGFTTICHQVSPWEVIDLLNQLYTVMDYLAEYFNLYKVETVGDAYMCCSGLPEADENHAENVANFAIAVVECVKHVKSPVDGETPIQLRVGIHTGSCTAGVVGTLTPHYCLFGDMVNTTARHESTGKAGKVQCSSLLFGRLKHFSAHQEEQYHFRPRGLVSMKGKGDCYTYWLEGGTEHNSQVNAEALAELSEDVLDRLERRTWKKRRYFKSGGQLRGFRDDRSVGASTAYSSSTSFSSTSKGTSQIATAAKQRQVYDEDLDNVVEHTERDLDELDEIIAMQEAERREQGFEIDYDLDESEDSTDTSHAYPDEGGPATQPQELKAVSSFEEDILRNSAGSGAVASLYRAKSAGSNEIGAGGSQGDASAAASFRSSLTRKAVKTRDREERQRTLSTFSIYRHHIPSNREEVDDDLMGSSSHGDGAPGDMHLGSMRFDSHGCPVVMPRQQQKASNNHHRQPSNSRLVMTKRTQVIAEDCWADPNWGQGLSRGNLVAKLHKQAFSPILSMCMAGADTPLDLVEQDEMDCQLQSMLERISLLYSTEKDDLIDDDEQCNCQNSFQRACQVAIRACYLAERADEPLLIRDRWNQFVLAFAALIQGLTCSAHSAPSCCMAKGATNDFYHEKQAYQCGVNILMDEFSELYTEVASACPGFLHLVRKSVFATNVNHVEQVMDRYAAKVTNNNGTISTPREAMERKVVTMEHIMVQAELGTCLVDFASRPPDETTICGTCCSVPPAPALSSSTSVVADRMLKEQEQRQQKQKQHGNKTSITLFDSDNPNPQSDSNLNNSISMRTSSMQFLEFSQNEGKEAKHDLFPETTVFFADIEGFSAWSSMRRPDQIFSLLEEIFHAFDEIANSRHVFTVETVGDCYIAVTGLPEPRPDHAVVMARFAGECLDTFVHSVTEMETKLGPDTGDLGLRIGVHSGPVTAGVLRGFRARFQLFGDTINTTACMESTCLRNKIQMSQETADELRAAGKSHWIKPRVDRVVAKGKGKVSTYWLELGESAVSGIGLPALSRQQSLAFAMRAPTASSRLDSSSTSSSDARKQRLVEWNTESLLGFLKQIEAYRDYSVLSNSEAVETRVVEVESKPLTSPLDEVEEIITLPTWDGHAVRDANLIELGDCVKDQLRDYVGKVADMYRDNHFHNFEHASHVQMSTIKLLSRIVRPNIDNKGSKTSNKTLHDHTYGITSDPLTQFSCALSAVIHDAEHTGAPNTQLIKENSPLAETYKRSIAEQNSVDIAWALLMKPEYLDLRRVIYRTEDEFKRFRQLVVNAVMATDIMDKDLKTLRNGRWQKAFSEDETAAIEDAQVAVNRKATIVIEHLIQASDVAHTMQHWHIFRKWNERLFQEMYVAYKQGRATTNPADFWYKGEIGFFDFYIIPLAKKLKDCGVFGVSSDEYLNYAERNRKEWEEKGHEVVEMMLEKVQSLHSDPEKDVMKLMG